MLRAIVRYLLGKQFVSIEQLYEAVSIDRLTTVEAPPSGWPGREGYVRLINYQTSLFYKEKWWADGKHVETLDIITIEYLGGVWVIFVNDEIHSLTHNSSKRDVQTIEERERQLLWQILLKVRQIVQS